MFDRENKRIERGKVLEIGCGDGFNLLCLASAVEPKGQYVGVDVSQARIATAINRKNEEYDLGHKRLSFLMMDGSYLGFTNASFDIVICMEVLEHLPRPDLCVSEMFRILKPGGAAIITTPNPESIFLKLSKVLKYFSKSSKISLDRRDHISIKNFAEWKDMFLASGFLLEIRKRGALFLGGPKYDSHRVLFALAIIVETILDIIPIWWNLSEDIILLLRKPFDKGY